VYRPRKMKPNRILWGILTAILAIHLFALAIFGGITLFEAIKPADSTFEEPPPAEKIERVQLEYKVRMQEKQKQSARPKQKLQVKSVQNLAMPEVDIQVPNLNATSNIGRFGSGGFGNLGDGSGLDVGSVSVDLFDLKSKGEKFLFIIDVERELMTDAKGGLFTYNVIKKDLMEQIGTLPSGVLFNVMIFDEKEIEIWRPNLVPAIDSNKNDFEQWLTPINSSASRIGVRKANFSPVSWKEGNFLLLEKKAVHWHEQIDKFLIGAAMLEQRADVIYIFTDSLPGMHEAEYYSDENRDEFEERFSKLVRREGFDSIEQYEKRRNEVRPRVDKEIEKFKKRENAERAKKNLPPRVYNSVQDFHLRMDMEKELEDEIDNFPTYIPEKRNYTQIRERDMEDSYERLIRFYYDQNNDERPVLNAVIFKGEDEAWTAEQDDGVDDFVDLFNGDYRVLKGLGSIDTNQFLN